MAAAALLIGLSKTGIPGAGILPIAMAALVLPAKASTGILLPMLIAGDIFAVAFYRRHAVWKHLVALMPFAGVGIVIGYFLMGIVTDAQLKPIIGGVILVMLALNWLRSRGRLDEKIVQTIGGDGDVALPGAPDDAQSPPTHVSPFRRWGLAAGIGLLGGVVTMMANSAGPIMIVYLLAMRLPKHEFIGTAAWYFLLVNCFKIPFSSGLGLINPESLAMNLILLPMIVIGALAGVRILRRLPEKGFTAIVQILAAVGAAWLVVGGLF